MPRVADSIVIAVSNILTMFCTAWIIYRMQAGRSPIPTRHKPVEVSADVESNGDEPHLERGRPIL